MSGRDEIFAGDINSNMIFKSEISIITGHYGSGKTEIAVNAAKHILSLKNKTIIVDMDIINPFFRTADVKTELSKKGIRVITPVYANTNVDVPALPPEINSIFDSRECRVVIDTGGDDIGARVLSRYKNEIIKKEYEVYLTVNINRPFSQNSESIRRVIFEIESSSGLEITSIINNTNLMQYTTEDNIMKGQKIIEEVIKTSGKKFAFISGYKKNMSYFEKKGYPVFYIEKHMNLPW